jgi:hypothetical protein
VLDFIGISITSALFYSATQAVQQQSKNAVAPRPPSSRRLGRVAGRGVLPLRLARLRLEYWTALAHRRLRAGQSPEKALSPLSVNYLK